MSDSSEYYDKVIQDLLEQRDEIDRMIADARRLKQFSALRKGVFRQAPNVPAPTRVPPKIERTPSKPENITLVDGSESILREIGQPMHARAIVEHLAKIGKVTSVRSLNSTLIGDKKNRFQNYGSNTFGLTEWGDSAPVKESVGSNGHLIVNTLSIGDGIEQILRSAGRPLPVLPDIVDAVASLGITTTESSIRATLSNDRRQRFVRAGQGVYTLRNLVSEVNTEDDLQT